jgi:hypothetical protein
MGNIERRTDENAQLTIYTAKGNISGEEVRVAIGDFYEHGPITRNVLWDVSQAVLNDMSAEDIRQIAHVPRQSLELRKDGKTAIVAPSDLAFGLSRMYQISSQPEPLSFEVQVFRDSEAAHKWLAEKTVQEE